jgi:hypothetical protein
LLKTFFGGAPGDAVAAILDESGDCAKLGNMA